MISKGKAGSEQTNLLQTATQCIPCAMPTTLPSHTTGSTYTACTCMSRHCQLKQASKATQGHTFRLTPSSKNRVPVAAGGLVAFLNVEAPHMKLPEATCTQIHPINKLTDRWTEPVKGFIKQASSHGCPGLGSGRHGWRQHWQHCSHESSSFTMQEHPAEWLHAAAQQAAR